MDNKVILTRELLHSLVWAMPTTQLAEKFGISDVALGKICSKYDIPKPTRGQWARIQAGEKVDVKPLPKWREPSASIRIEIRQQLHRGPVPMSPPDKKEKGEHRGTAVLTECTNLALIERTRVALSKAKPEEHSRDVQPGDPDCLSMVVQVEHVERVLRLWTKLIIEAKNRGWTIQCVEAPYPGPYGSRSITQFHINGVIIGVGFKQLGNRMRPSREDCLRIFDSASPIEVLPLRFTLFPETPRERGAIRLQEKTGRYFEDHIDWLVTTLEGAAKDTAEKRKQREMEDRIRHEEYERELRLKERQEKESAWFRGLRASIDKWRDYHDGMKMLDELEVVIAEGGRAAPDELVEWISWARTKLEAEHPFGEILNCKFPKRDEAPYHLRYGWNNAYSDWDSHY